MTKCLTVIVLNVLLFIGYTHKILMAYDGEESQFLKHFLYQINWIFFLDICIIISSVS